MAVPIFAMLPLDWMTTDGKKLSNPEELKKQLQELKKASLSGVMGDVWWGACEKQPGQYEFGAAKELCSLLRDIGLQFQAVMSFHSCGGNVGDSVNIPLPPWAKDPAEAEDLLYRTKCGKKSTDCLSLSCDHKAIFPGAGASGYNAGSTEPRTALKCYSDYMAAFCTAVKEHLGTEVVEIQVGCGPCGELRYPSYMGDKGWQYPGVGLLTAYDAGMCEMLSAADLGEKVYKRDADGCLCRSSEPPNGFPEDQNQMPKDVPLFAKVKGRETPGLRPFLQWYHETLVAHGASMLDAAAAGLSEAGGSSCSPEKLCFSVKVAGLHWHVMHPSRLTEALAGYDCMSHDAADAYGGIAKMLASASEKVGRPVLFNFTCLEMHNNKYGEADAQSAPEDLIAQVRRACVFHDVELAGENALELDLLDKDSFAQMRKQLHGWSQGRDKMHGLTLLRLNPSWFEGDRLEVFRKWIESI